MQKSIRNGILSVFVFFGFLSAGCSNTSPKGPKPPSGMSREYAEKCWYPINEIRSLIMDFGITSRSISEQDFEYLSREYRVNDAIKTYKLIRDKYLKFKRERPSCTKEVNHKDFIHNTDIKIPKIVDEFNLIPHNDVFLGGVGSPFPIKVSWGLEASQLRSELEAAKHKKLAVSYKVGPRILPRQWKEDWDYNRIAARKKRNYKPGYVEGRIYGIYDNYISIDTIGGMAYCDFESGSMPKEIIATLGHKAPVIVSGEFLYSSSFMYGFHESKPVSNDCTVYKIENGRVSALQASRGDKTNIIRLPAP